MNLDAATIIQGLVVIALAGLVGDHFRLRAEVAAFGVSLANLRTHVAEQYVRQPEIQRLEESVMRISNTLDELVKLVHEMKGQINRG